MRRLVAAAVVALVAGCQQILGLDDLHPATGMELESSASTPGSSGSSSTSTTAGPEPTTSQSSGGSDGPGVEPCEPPGVALEASIPPFASPSQSVDGLDDDFCGVPLAAWSATDDGRLVPAQDAESPDVLIRVAWSLAALHVHARILDADIRPNPERPYLGDALELFVSSTDEFDGAYDGGGDAGAVQVIATVGADGPLVALYPGEAPPLPGLEVTAARVEGGYVVEMFVPWRRPERVTINTRIGFDIALDSATGESLFSQSLLCLEPVASTSCASGDAHPSCDNRTWCRPRLARG